VTVHKGSCLCGAVHFEAEGELHPPDACHCTQCRKQSGHVWASTNVPKDKLRLYGADKISWYQSSQTVRRGFCSVCGSVLFWEPAGYPWTAIAMGAFETPTGTQLAKHIFVAEQGDYYRIADGLPQSDGH
jgi:hypothetical protein